MQALPLINENINNEQVTKGIGRRVIRLIFFAIRNDFERGVKHTVKS